MIKIFFKTLFTIILTNLCINIVYSQNSFGIKTGINLSKVKYDDANIDAIISPYKKIKPGINAGFYFSNELNKMMTVNIEILYSQKGLKYYQISYSEGKNTMNYIEIPAIGGLNYYLSRHTKFNFYIGGYYAYWLSGKYISSDLYTSETTITKVDFHNPDWEYNRNDAGLLGGIKYLSDKKKLSFDIRYTHSMLPSSKKVADGVYNRTISINIGIEI